MLYSGVLQNTIYLNMGQIMVSTMVYPMSRYVKLEVYLETLQISILRGSDHFSDHLESMDPRRAIGCPKYVV